MVASNTTIRAVAVIILRHMKRGAALPLLRELATVEGSKSFRDTIKNLISIIERS